jgi:uncharacterized protein YdeI (YjbR/CyaY-like superfamily)
MPVTGTQGVEIPDELAIALAANETAQVAFDALDPAQQFEWAREVDDAKEQETRQRRAAKCIEALTQGEP